MQDPLVDKGREKWLEADKLALDEGAAHFCASSSADVDDTSAAATAQSCNAAQECQLGVEVVAIATPTAMSTIALAAIAGP